MQRKSKDETVIVEFRRRRNNQIIALIPLAVVLLGFAWYRRHGPMPTILGCPSNFVGLVSVVIVIACVAYGYSNWICPNCRSPLGKKWNPSACGQCGVPFA